MYLLSSVGLLSSAVNAWTPPARPALWPAAFRVAITTNITFSPEPGAPPPLTAHPIAGVMYYDWAASASQAVEHGAGNYECSHFYGTYGPCRLVFNPQGLFADAPGAASGDACCLDLPAITASPPDWAARSNATLVSAAGPVIEPTSGALCHHWKWDWGEAGPCHHYWERASDGLPVLFTFPGGANGTQDWHFDLSTFAAGAQDPARFALAPACFHNCTPHAAGRRSSRSSSSSSTPMTMTAAATAAAAAAHRRAAADATWESYKQQFNKVYPVGGAEEEEEEEARRRGIFERNLLSYAALNAREPLARYGPTALSDRAPAEYLGGYRPPSSPAALSSPQPRDAELLGDASRQVPASADWTGRYTSPVKDQGSCGACWADSAIEQVESDAMRQHNWSGVLSTQELVDCTNAGQGSWRAGCGGGNPTDGYDVLQALGGAASGYEYTYRGRDSRCAVDNFTKYVTVTSYASVGARNETEMRSYVGSTGPLSVCVDASDWGGYSGGIKTTCGTSTDHCVQLVGYGTDQGVAYWKVRNSWGGEWGEEGFIRLKIGAAGAAGLCNVAVGPTATSTSAQRGPAPVPSPSAACSDSPVGWRSSEGDPCSLYVLNSYCTAGAREGPGWNRCAWGPITDYADSKGRSALDACCGCGGGTAPVAPPPPTPAPPPPTCADKPANWASSEGDSCCAFQWNSYCTPEGKQGPSWDPGWGPISDYADKNGISALTACCVCGGGSNTTTADDDEVLAKAM